MNRTRQRFWGTAIVFWFGAILTLLMPLATLAQQGQPPLQITSPTDGMVVNPGATVPVTVVSPTNASFSGVGVIGEDPIGISGTATTVPAQLSITIPSDIDSCRPYTLTAIGSTVSGQPAESDPVLIDVERPDMPTSLSALMPSITFSVIGEKSPTQLLASFSDGTMLEVTRSSYVVYSSSNATVATVDANGIVAAVAPGTTSVTATYALNGQSVQLSIPVTVPTQVMAVSPVSLAFGNQNVGTSSSARQLSVMNAGNGALTMISVASSGDFSETDNCVSSSPIPVGGNCTVNVTFAPTAAGVSAGSITIANGFDSIPTVIALAGAGIGQPTTSTALTSSANPSVLGQAVTLTATVTSASGAPTGSITFSDGSTALGTVSLSSGAATLTASSFSVGTHSITASYGGDGTFLGSSAALTQVVNPAATAVTVTPSANPSIVNSSVTFTAAVSVRAPGAGTPTGSITFKDGSAGLATVALNSTGQATFSTSALSVGAHSVTAVYSGDSNFNGSTSTALIQSIVYEEVGTQCDGDAGHQILQPIAADGSSVFKQGSTVPAKFRVCDTNGNSIGTAGVVSNFILASTQSGTVVDQVNEPVLSANPDTVFRWDPTAQQWIFNISTDNLTADMTYFYQITLNDGTAVNFSYGLR